MALVALTAANLSQLIAENTIVVIDFWAAWCGPCRAFKPVFHAAAERHPDVTFATCDTEAEPQVAAAFGIRSIPTVAIFREQVLLYSQPGALPGEGLDQLVAQVVALDMDRVRADIAERNAVTPATA